MTTRKINSDEDFKLLRILMAEDDEINQALARNLFKKNGWTCDIVENGQQAIEKLHQSIYDLVLLDIEMPKLNGYMTTIKIRNEFTSPLAEVPIIAITAHDSHNELQKCLDVGMDGYIFKPIKLKELTDKIKTIFNGEEEVPLTEMANPVTTASEANVKTSFNMKNLYASCGNNPAIVKNIVKLFVAQTPGNIKQLEDYIGQQDWEGYKGLCHKMKSTYSLIGVFEIKEYLQEMEEDCGANNINVTKFQSYIAIIKGLNLGLIQELQKEIN